MAQGDLRGRGQPVNLRYVVGQALARVGWSLQPTYKLPTGTLDVAQLAARLLAAGAELPVVLQVGAFDGVSNDPMRRLLAAGLFKRAVLVDPQAEAARALRALYAGDRRVEVVEAALVRHPGPVTLYSPRPFDPRASLRPSHIERFGLGNPRTSIVDGISVADLKARAGLESIDLLQIDCEGEDLEIVSLLLDSYAPKVINLEKAHLSKAERVVLDGLLRARAYHWHDHGRDCLCISERWLEELFAAA